MTSLSDETNEVQVEKGENTTAPTATWNGVIQDNMLGVAVDGPPISPPLLPSEGATEGRLEYFRSLLVGTAPGPPIGEASSVLDEFDRTRGNFKRLAQTMDRRNLRRGIARQGYSANLARLMVDDGITASLNDINDDEDDSDVDKDKIDFANQKQPGA